MNCITRPHHRRITRFISAPSDIDEAGRSRRTTDLRVLRKLVLDRRSGQLWIGLNLFDKIARFEPKANGDAAASISCYAGR